MENMAIKHATPSKYKGKRGLHKGSYPFLAISDQSLPFQLPAQMSWASCQLSKQKKPGCLERSKGSPYMYGISSSDSDSFG